MGSDQHFGLRFAVAILAFEGAATFWRPSVAAKQGFDLI